MEVSAVKKASLARYVWLLQKVQANKQPLSGPELKELEKYEAEMKKKNEKPSNNEAQTDVKPTLTAGRKMELNASTLKLLAFLGKSIAECETILVMETPKTARKNKKNTKKTPKSTPKTLNQIFIDKPELKAAFERGRFLKALADLAESNLTIAEIEAELKKNQFLKKEDELAKIFAADSETADLFNQSRHKHIIDVQQILKANLHKASPAAIRAYKTLFVNEMAVPAADLSHITSKQMQDITGKTRQTVENDWPKKFGLSRNSDGTFNLAVFFPWFEAHTINTKTSGGRSGEPEALRSKKAEMLDIELKERTGQLLDRRSVIAGLVGRTQLEKNMFDKFIDKVPALIENQPVERIRKIIEDSFTEIRNEMIKHKLELKLSPELQTLFDTLMEKA